MATDAKYECEIRFKMSDKNQEEDEVRQNSGTPEKGKKKRTFVGATHILKAEAIRQLELKEQEFENKGEKVEDNNKSEERADRPLLDKTEQAKDEEEESEKIAPRESGNDVSQPGGADSLINSDSDLKDSNITGKEPHDEVINNLDEKISGLGNDSVIEKAKESVNEKAYEISESTINDNQTDSSKLIVAESSAIGNSAKLEATATGDKAASGDNTAGETRNSTEPSGNIVDSEKSKPVDNQKSDLPLETVSSPVGEQEKENIDADKTLGDGSLSAEDTSDKKVGNEIVSKSDIKKEQDSTAPTVEDTRKEKDNLQGVDSKKPLSTLDSSTFQEKNKQTKESEVLPKNVLEEKVDDKADTATSGIKIIDDKDIENSKSENISENKGAAMEAEDKKEKAESSAVENDVDEIAHKEGGDDVQQDGTKKNQEINRNEEAVSDSANNESDPSLYKVNGMPKVDETSSSNEESKVSTTVEEAAKTDATAGVKKVDAENANGNAKGNAGDAKQEGQQDPDEKQPSKDDTKHEKQPSKDDTFDKEKEAGGTKSKEAHKDNIGAESDGDRPKEGLDAKVIDDEKLRSEIEGTVNEEAKQEVSQSSEMPAAEPSNTEDKKEDIAQEKGNESNVVVADGTSKIEISGDAVAEGKGAVEEKTMQEEGKNDMSTNEDGKKSNDGNGHRKDDGKSSEDESQGDKKEDGKDDGIDNKEENVKNDKKNSENIKKKDGGKSDGDDIDKSDKKGNEENDDDNDEEVMEDKEGNAADDHDDDHKVPENFYYDYDDIMSKPITTEGIPQDMVKLYHSFGFECTKRSNMHMLDTENILFAAGNVVQILNIKQNEMKYIRSIGGGGVGAIAVHPSRKYFAVAEKGEKPSIMIYEYPSLRVYRILREGTEKAYANLDFSPNGDKLASVGSAPDYMLTVWDWMNENIELRSKAFSQDIYKVAFSPENEGHLCSSGTGHIRFWSMAETFTGLKLQGELGRFGTTELSDIAGFVELPDGKVLSGSEWGNMLLWDGGLIKVEIARKGKKTCHHGMIEQFFLDEGELITIGIDGFVKVWDFETIDTAEAADESKIFEMEPMSELKVGSDVKLVSMVKSVNQNEASIWYAQDGSGGIWKLDLSFSHTSQAPKRLYSFHSGPIKGIALSPMTHLSATVGSDHTVRLFDYLAKNPLCYSRFTAPGSSIIWMPKTVDPDGLSVLAGFEDGVVRQLTVVKRDQNAVATKKDSIKFELKLTQVFKPHVKAVTALAVSKDGKFLATGSDDSTVFFFSIDKTYKPIGFIETGGAVASLDWSSVQKKNTLLICGKDGYVLEVSCPTAGDYDTSKTFLIPLTGLKRTEFKFKSIKDKLVKEEEDLRKAKEEEERRKQKEEEKRKKKERGIVEDEDEENEEEEEEGEERVETPKEEVFHEQGQIVNGFYNGDTGNFWLLLDGWDAGYIYECAFSESDDVTAEPLKAIKFDEIDDVPVRSYCFSKTSQYMALGLDNGSIRVQILESRDIQKLDNYWCLNMHDNHNGAVTDISLSFDEKFLLSVGNDGNFFVYSFMDEEKLKRLIGKQKADIAKKLDSTKFARIDDIEDPNHYSIELEKQKAEHDRMVRLAEEKKQRTRQTVNLLRREFKRLVSRNQEMPSYLQLPPSEFIIDPNMKSDIDAETKAKLNLVEKEMAWESEKHLLSLRKLETRFKDMIECELFRLHAFKTQHSVTSYRATVLPPEFSEALEENKNRIKTAENETGAPAMTKRLSVLAKKARATSRDESIHEEKGGDNAIQSKKSKPVQKLDGKIAKAIEKAEQNRKRRMERKAKWDELYRSKPDLDYEDPANVAAIKEAHENMGDFKLKSADDYIVPEKERVNADKKRAQIMQLKEQIHQLKRSFNEKLLNLRNRKVSIIGEVKSLTDQLENVQNGLPLSMHTAIPPVPVMQPDEQPESLFDYTSETLEKFKNELHDGNQNVKTENSGGFGGGFGGFGAAAEQTQQPATKMTSQLTSTRTDQRGRSTSILSTLSSQPRSASSVAIDHGSPETINEEVIIDDEPSDMEMKVRDEQRIRLVYQRDMLLQKIKDLLTAFDAELRLLRHEKIHLDVDLKNADLRMITLFEELVLLKEFEKRENVLMEKVLQKMQEKDEMEEKVDDCQMKLQLKKEEIENLQEKEKTLSTVFSNLFLESNKFEAFLTKVYKKKIKRVKKTEQDAGSDEDSDEDLSDDDYDSEEDEDSDAEELDDSVCPPGCDQALFDQVCQLREKRLDLEEATVEEKKAADTLKKELDALKKKAKVIESNLVSAEADLEAFQREKQQKLNELDIVVTLKLNQLQYLNNNALPQDLTQCLVFTSSSLGGLQGRIIELDKEKGEQKKLYWKLRQQHVMLIRDKKSMEEKISQLEEKVQQMQLLKFGRLVDLEKLETVSVNRAAEELKEQLRSQEFSNAKEIGIWEKRIDDAKAKLTQVTRENTQRLDTYTVLLQEKKELEQTLDSRQKSLGGEFQGNRKADYQERQRLIQLVQLQSQEIDALKEEIGLLSRKGGHILPPSQAPVSNATTATR